MILVTGASGIVGHYVVEALINSNQEVRVTYRKHSNRSRLKHISDKIEWIEADVLDIPALSEAFQDIDRVVHCAAIVSFHREDKERMMQVNVEGTANMVNLALKYGVEKFIYVSSVAALGRKSGVRIIDEDVKWEASENNTKYAESKYLAELEVWRAQEEGLSTAIVNPSIIIGYGDWDSSSMQLFKYINQNRKFYPPGEMNYVDVRDVSAAIVSLLFNEIEGERFIVSAGKEKYNKVFQLIAQHLNRSVPSIKVNKALLTFIYILDNAKSKLIGKRSTITRETTRVSKLTYLYSNDKVIEKLKVNFRPLEESVKWTCEEIRKQLI